MKFTKNLHGGDIYSFMKKSGRNIENIYDFSANISPLGIPQKVKEAMIKSIDNSDRYPDTRCEKLTNKIASYHNIDRNYIYCANGAAEIIFRISRSVNPLNSIITAPTFSEYEASLDAVKSNIFYYNLIEKNEFNIKLDILDMINDDIDIVYICNPNNPTGQITSKEKMYKIARMCKKHNVLLVIDECFNEFIDNPESFSMIEYLNEFSNMILLKAFTKTYAMAGVRLGYCLSSNTQMLDKIRKSGQQWNVSVMAQEGGIVALDEKKYVKDLSELIKTERKYLLQNLQRIGFKVYKSYTNYILFKSSFNTDLQEKLFGYGIIIRSCANYNGLSDKYYRVAVRTKKENEYLINSLEKVVKNEVIANDY